MLVLWLLVGVVVLGFLIVGGLVVFGLLHLVREANAERDRG
ncbi:hypothetical protein DFR75_11254 [Nocardia ignorata]|uniref:Uncharacterized protein n=1 Tax=Nocardia ignorata TaxID=145285 RepID=A0A4R6NYD6_NOCIG|nr:hypothetical protein DFR75_11254 [Nocardia ignorata]